MKEKSAPKLVVAFDSFKGSLTAMEACSAAEAGVRHIWPECKILKLPMSDGGEGMVAGILDALSLEKRRVTVHGPLGEPIVANYAMSADRQTAYMEMAEAAGLTLVPEDCRNPVLTTTYGVGEMIADAICHGVKHIIMGIGGSATCDGGQGMLECMKEMGLLDIKGRIVSQALRDCRFVVASDVDNPLCGERGAARVFAPQKGATPEQVEQLERRLYQFACQTAKAGIASLELMDAPGAGAAGGLGYGLMAYLGAKLQFGIELYLDILDFDRQASGAELIITGEGKSDRQTLMGKVAHGVLSRAKELGIPCHLLSGQIEEADHLKAAGFETVGSIHEGDSRPLPVLMQKDVSYRNISLATERLLMARGITS